MGRNYWYLKGIRLPRLLGKEAMRWLVRAAREVSYPHHQGLPHETKWVMLIQQGRMRLILPSSDESQTSKKQEQKKVEAVLGPGDVLGCLGIPQASDALTAETMDEVNAWMISQARWRACLQRYPGLVVRRRGFRFWRHPLEVPLRELSERSLTARIAWVLLQLHTDHRDWRRGTAPMRLHFSISDLAVLAAAPRDRVASVLEALEHAGIIQRRRRTWFIRSPWGLRKWSRRTNADIPPVPPSPPPEEFSLFPLGSLPMEATTRDTRQGASGVQVLHKR